MDKNELYRLIQQKENENERNTFKRFIYTVLIHAAILFVILCATDGIAGVGIAAVADHSLGIAVRNILLGHRQRRAFHQIGGVYRRGRGGYCGNSLRPVFAFGYNPAAYRSIGVANAVLSF